MNVSNTVVCLSSCCGATSSQFTPSPGSRITIKTDQLGRWLKAPSSLQRLPSIMGLGALELRARKVWCGKNQASSGEDRMASEGGQECLWQEFFSDPAKWWDNRRTKKTNYESLWVDNWNKSIWVVSDKAMLDGQLGDGTRMPHEYVSISVPGASGRLDAIEGDLDVTSCRKPCEHGKVGESVAALNLLVQQGCDIPNKTFYLILKRCLKQNDLILGRRIHALTVSSGYEGDAFLATHLIGLYASHEMLKEAMAVFSKVRPPSAHNWASIISAFARNGEPTQAIQLYRQMRESTVKPDNRIFVAVLNACASAGDLAAGKDVHAHIHASGGKPDMFLQNSLVDMYAKCGSLMDARRLFDRLPKRDVVTWTALIAGYAQQGMGQEALSLYSRMQREGITPPDSITFVCLLQACACVGVPALHQGVQLCTQIEEQGLQDDLVVGASLVNMYAKCGSLENAQRLFDRLPRKNVVTWTGLIAGYAQQGLCREALAIYSRMQQEGITSPNSVTFTSLLQACASAAALPLGRQLHAQIQQRGLEADVAVGSSLVNMYAKCGSLEDAQQVFDSLPERQVVAWGALVAGYARQGDSEIVFGMVDRMKLEGILPDGITFLSVLTVCSHLGLVDKGRTYFEAMITDYGISPTIEHYTCMVDLLGRAGQLDEALLMVKSLPFDPDGTVWRTLLGACRKWVNVEVGQQAFEFAVKLDRKDTGAYSLMSNIYVAAHMWERAQEIQFRRVKSGAWKEPGQSWWNNMDGGIHSFVVGDNIATALISAVPYKSVRWSSLCLKTSDQDFE